MRPTYLSVATIAIVAFVNASHQSLHRGSLINSLIVLMENNFFGAKLLNSGVLPSSSTCNATQASSEWRVCGDLVEKAIRHPDGCLVYSFGIAEEDAFSNHLAMKGCKVYGFDPTVNQSTHFFPRIEFYSIGLRGHEKVYGNGSWQHSTYGRVTGELMTYAQILNRFGHTKRAPDIIKFDCEGCEWSVFKSMLHDIQSKTLDRHNLPRQILTEFHFSKSLRMKSAGDFMSIKYAPAFLIGHGYKMFYCHKNDGFPTDREIDGRLLRAGVERGRCCSEISFVLE